MIDNSRPSSMLRQLADTSIPLSVSLMISLRMEVNFSQLMRYINMMGGRVS